MFAAYVSFASEFEEQSKLLLEKVEQATSCLNGRHGDELQGECLNVWNHKLT